MEGINIKISGNSLFIHQSILIYFCICLLVCFILYFLGKKFKRADYKVAPSGALLVGEVIVDFIYGVLNGNFKEKTWDYIYFYGTIMIIMVLSNLAGMFGVQVPTSNLSVSLTLACIMIFLIHFKDIKVHGIVNKIKNYFEPYPFLFPLNIIGDLALPLSLSFRLFGNMLGGSIIVSLLYLMIQYFLPYSAVAYFITPFLHMYFDIFAAFMQTYIFFTVSTFFIGQSEDL